MKKLMLTNISSRKFTTSQGDFHPGTSKEFDEKEAIDLLGYTKEIARTEDAMKNPKLKDRMEKLNARIAEKDKEIEALKEEQNKKLEKKNGKILDLEGKIAELEKKLKEKKK